MHQKQIYFLVLKIKMKQFENRMLRHSLATLEGEQEFFVFYRALAVEVYVPECHFQGTGFFPSRAFGNILFPVLSSIPPFGTGHFPSRLSPKNEMGIPEFEISGKIGKNSRNSVLDWKFPVGY